MRAPSPTLRYLRRALERGHLDVIMRDGDRLAEAMAVDPALDGELTEIALLIGAAHAAADRLATAEAYLEGGLERARATVSAPDRPAPRGVYDAPAPPPGPLDPAPWPAPPGPTGTITPGGAPPSGELPPPTPRGIPSPAHVGAPRPMPPMPPPSPSPSPVEPGPYGPRYPAPPGADGWTAPAGEARNPWAGLAGPPPRALAPSSTEAPRRDPLVDWSELLLCEVHLRTGRTAEAEARLVTLTEPERDATIRFAALRAQAFAAALDGRYERGHHLLNTAGGLAVQISSRFRGALVERDRAVILAREGRLPEGVALSARLALPLLRPLTGPYQRWARREAASMALALARIAARAGDGQSAHELLAMGTAALDGVDDPVLEAHRRLARAIVFSGQGEPDELEDLLTRATATFEHSGDRPAAALVALEHGRLAHLRGLDRSARPLYQQAAAELRACGWTVDATEGDRLRADLDAGRPPTFRYGNVP